MERIALRVGDVAARAGVYRETLRHYERRGLIPAPPRRSSGYRAYPADAVERVRLIDRLQARKRRLRALALCRCSGDCAIVARAATNERRRSDND